MTAKSSFHRGRNPQGLMYSAEVVPRDVKRDSGLEVIQLLAEGVNEPRKAPKVHSEVEIRPFDMAGANVCFVRVAGNLGWDRLDNLARAVPVRAAVLRLAVNFHQL